MELNTPRRFGKKYIIPQDKQKDEAIEGEQEDEANGERSGALDKRIRGMLE
ncbi:MAG: hypothetical protein Q9203_004769 [Teloschistes exilis]